MDKCPICGMDVPYQKGHRRKYCSEGCAGIAHTENAFYRTMVHALNEYLDMTHEYGHETLRVWDSSTCSQEELRKLIPERRK